MEAQLTGIDRDNYSKVYSMYFPKLVRFSQTFLLSRQDAENTVQDIFLYIWENIDVIGPLGNVNAYLFTLVKNRCIDFLRNHAKTAKRNRSLSEILDKELELNLYSLQQFDENKLSAEELNAIITAAIDSLPKRRREIFVLSRLEGMRHKEIAERLNISTNTIEGQITIALQKLKEKLKDYKLLLLFLII